MEYTLTISQKAIAQNFPSLDLKDAAIIDFLGRFAHSPKIQKKIVGEVIYYWFDYGHIQAENPLLKLDAESIRKRIRAFCTLKILEPHPANQGGKPHFAFGKKYELTHREVRANLPDVETADFGQNHPKVRAESPDVKAKVRANLPDNQIYHSNQPHQSDVGDKSPAPKGRKKQELHAPKWMVVAFEEVYEKEFSGIGKFHWQNKHFGENGLSGFYSRLSKRYLEKNKAAQEVPDEALQKSWSEFLKIAASIDWVKRGFFTPTDLFNQFDKIGQEWKARQEKEKQKSKPENGAAYIPSDIPVFIKRD